MAISKTNIIAALQAMLTLVILALFTLSDHPTDHATLIIAAQAALSSAGFRAAADATMCCAKRRVAGTCPSPPQPSTANPS